MKIPPKNTIDYFILPNKIICSVVGLWPSDEERSIWNNMFIYFRLTLCVVSAASLFVPQIMLVAVNWGDIRILTGVGCTVLTFAQFFFKVFYIIARREKSYTVYAKLRSLWDSTDDPKERRCYEEFAYWARICTITFCSSGAVTALFFGISAAFDNIRAKHDSDDDISRQLPLEVWYGTDITKSPRFEIAFACQLVAIVISAVAVCALDTTCVSSILHVSGQFRLIGAWVSNIGVEMKCGSTNYAGDCTRNVAAVLIRCIRHHQRVIGVVDDVNNLLAPIIFMQLLTSGIEICLSVFVVVSSDSSNDLFRSIAYLASMMIQLIMWCWPGEILIQESQGVGHAVYLHVPWHKLPLNCRRHVLLMILRSQRYCCISALTLSSVSIHTLTSVFNTAASYLALLRQMEEKAALNY